jgi:hypothetical protein
MKNIIKKLIAALRNNPGQENAAKKFGKSTLYVLKIKI